MFSFLKNLFKNNHDSPKANAQDNINLNLEPQIELRMGVSSMPVPYTDIPFDLREYIAGRGHNDFPCLSPIYSSGSMMPCVDFTPWIISQLKVSNITNIKHLAYAIHRGAMSSGPSWAAYCNDPNTEIDKILRIPLERYITFDDEQAYYEIKAALIMIIIRNDFSWMVLAKEDALKYLTHVMSPYVPLVNETLIISEANKLTNKIRKSNATIFHWTETSNFAKANAIFYQDASLNNLQCILKRITLAARCHFFDALAYQDLAKNPKVMEDCTLYNTRMYGLDTTETSRELFQLGLFDKCTDPLTVLTIFTKQQLFEKYQDISNHPRKSWKKPQIIEFLVQNYPEKTQDIMNQFYVGVPSTMIANIKNELKQYVNNAGIFYAAWLAALINLEVGTSNK